MFGHEKKKFEVVTYTWINNVHVSRLRYKENIAMWA